jgi:hypothetical protein
MARERSKFCENRSTRQLLYQLSPDTRVPQLKRIAAQRSG